ncbi:MAG: hypothetical protein WD069_03410 [Planctomycetales bacterium]
MRAGRVISAAACVFALFWGGPHPAAAAKIEAVRGKQYAITKQHGPWMIMVASFGDRPRELYELERDGDINRVPNTRFADGLSAAEAADELVYELRQRGIPAYAFRQKAAIGTWNTTDRRGQMDRRVYRERDERIVVLAGNYGGVDDPVGQKTLEYVKKLKPASLDEGGVYSKTPGRPGPLSGAFLTINPLLSPEEVTRQQRTRDPLVLKLNSGIRHSLFSNPGEYTLAVATFRGKSVTTLGGNDSRFRIDDALDKAAQEAQDLAQFLNSNESMQASKIEAYVYHDRYESVVTVGAFDSPADPTIPQLAAAFGPKMEPNPETGIAELRYEQIVIWDAQPNPAGAPPVLLRPLRTWPLDPEPKVISVPKR